MFDFKESVEMWLYPAFYAGHSPRFCCVLVFRHGEDIAMDLSELFRIVTAKVCEKEALRS